VVPATYQIGVDSLIKVKPGDPYSLPAQAINPGSPNPTLTRSAVLGASSSDDHYWRSEVGGMSSPKRAPMCGVCYTGTASMSRRSR
jgi:hypothetical protein